MEKMENEIYRLREELETIKAQEKMILMVMPHPNTT